MATPEQNTLLAQQLFQRPAQEFAQGQEARRALALRLAQMRRDEELKRELANQGYAKAIELAGMTADREDARWKAAREIADKKEVARAEADDKRTNAAEAKQLRALISKAYYDYALEAEQAGEKVLPRETFTDDDKGLGEVTQAYARAKQANSTKKQKSVAELATAEVQDAATQFKTAKSQLDLIQQPSAQDKEFARSLAVKATETAITNSDTPPPKAAAEKGLAALRKGDTAEARSRLGDTIYGIYETELQRATLGLLNSPGRRQQITEAARATAASQQRLAAIARDYRMAAAQGTGNPELAAQLKAVLTPLQSLMTEEPKTLNDQQRMEQIFGKPQTGGPVSAPGGTTNPPPQAATSSNFQYPALSVLGAGERMLTGEQLAMAPANIAAFPGRVIDSAARVGGAGLRGLMTGDYSLPAKGIVQQAGEGIGSLLADNPYAATPPPPKPINVAEVLRTRPAGPWSTDELRAIQQLNAQQPQGPGILQRIFPGAKW